MSVRLYAMVEFSELKDILHSALNMPEYALTEFWIYLAFCICQDSEYVRF